MKLKEMREEKARRTLGMVFRRGVTYVKGREKRRRFGRSLLQTTAPVTSLIWRYSFLIEVQKGDSSNQEGNLCRRAGVARRIRTKTLLSKGLRSR